MYHTYGNGEEISGDDGWEEPMDEEMRLSLAYDKAVNEFAEAINGRAVYDQDGNEISDGPALAEYLYDQFLALGDYLDAADYLSFFKTREETITTEHGKTYLYTGELGNEYSIDHELPNYDVLGQVVDTQKLLASYGINDSLLSRDCMTLIRDENDVVTQVNIQTYRQVEDEAGHHYVDGSIIADLEYNVRGLLVASHVTEQNADGYFASYTTTFEYDSSDRCVKTFVPHGTYGLYDTHQANMDLYDEDGKLIQSAIVILPADPDFDGYLKGYALTKYVFVYDYNELGLVESMITYCHDYRGGGESEEYYKYDEYGRLIYKSSYSVYHGLDEDDGYSWEEIGKILDARSKSIFYPSASDEVIYDDWLVNERIDVSEWDWIEYEKTLQSEEFYTYDKTVTIMYIDLTPED